MRVVFNTPRIANEWAEVSHSLRLVINWTLENVWPEGDHEFHPDFVFTCIGRTAKENKAMGGHPSSPHVRPSPTDKWRAADARNRTLNDAQRATIVTAVNNQFVYDPERPFLNVLLSNDVWSTGPHFHFQVHPKTRRRVEKA